MEIMAATQGQLGVEVLEQIGKGGDGKSPLGCMQCGLCAASCPLGESMEFPPRKLILQVGAGNLEKVLASPSLWMCVGCYLCSERCPRDIELTDGLWPALRDRAMQQGFQPPAELQETFQNIFKYGNALGKSPRQRLDWAKDLEVRVLDLSKERRPVEVLWLVGCYPSYYPRNHLVTRAFARILTELGVTWGVLGAKERALGECDRMFGEEGLFETLVEQNQKLLGGFEFDKIVVLDPHAFRALEDLLPPLRRLVSGRALQHLPRRPPGAAQAADRPAGRGHGHVSRQLLPGAALRVLRAAAGACCRLIPGAETGGDVPPSRQRPLLRRRRRRHVAGRPYRRPGRPPPLRRAHPPGGRHRRGHPGRLLSLRAFPLRGRGQSRSAWKAS